MRAPRAYMRNDHTLAQREQYKRMVALLANIRQSVADPNDKANFVIRERFGTINILHRIKSNDSVVFKDVFCGNHFAPAYSYLAPPATF